MALHCWKHVEKFCCESLSDIFSNSAEKLSCDFSQSSESPMDLAFTEPAEGLELYGNAGFK